MAKDKFVEEFQISYDRKIGELTISYDGSLRNAEVYCETLKLNGTEIEDIQVKRDIEGRIASIKIKNYIDYMENPRLEDLFNQISAGSPISFFPKLSKRKS